MKHILTILPGIIFLLSSCDKSDNTDPNNPGNTALIKSVVFDNVGIDDFTQEFSYDAQGRNILQKVSFDGASSSLDYHIETEYLSNEIIQKKFDKNNTLTETNRLLLNSKSLIDSSVENNGNLRSKYFYNSEGFLVIQHSYDAGNKWVETKVFNYLNGSIIALHTTTASGLGDSQIEYSDFETGKNNTLRNENFGQSYRGKNSQLYAKKAKITQMSGTTEFNYTPGYDVQGRITNVETRSETTLLATTTISYY
ncbi:MAG: hypothetical protein IT267_10395 [Saprospiraceae bacterium]|nr:hypothetical protein [Saprospiraceae bacterium]